MYRAIVFLTGLVLLVKTQNMRECFETIMFNGRCCLYKPLNDKEDIAMECLKSVGFHHHGCEVETCFAEKVGFLLTNGTVDKTTVETMLETDFANNTDLLETVKEKCLIDDLRMYGPPHKSCYVADLTHCIRFQTVLNCPNWNDTESCTEVKEKISECQSLFP